MEKLAATAIRFLIAILVILTTLLACFGLWCLYVDIGAKLWPDHNPWTYSDFGEFLALVCLLQGAYLLYKEFRSRHQDFGEEKKE